MDYVIAAALLPQDKLWTVEYSWKMVEAITPEIPQIEDETELIELIRHAWLWDKNAMIQYARIQKEVGDDDVRHRAGDWRGIAVASLRRTVRAACAVCAVDCVRLVRKGDDGKCQ